MCGDHRDLNVLTHSFPTRRSSDLPAPPIASSAAPSSMPSRTSSPGPISAPSTPRPIPAAAPSFPPSATTSCRRPSPVEPAADRPTASTMPARPRPTSEREQLDLFRALPGDLAPRDAQDLMAYPFFSLAKSKRLAPID